MEQDTLQYETSSSPRGLGPRGIATMAVKLVGVYCVLQSLSLFEVLGYVIEALTSSGSSVRVQPSRILFALLPFALYGTIGILLFIYAERVAPLLLPRSAQASGEEPARASEIQGVGYSIVGVILISRALPKLIAAIASNNGLLAFLPDRSSGRHVVVIETICELIIGLILFFRGNGLAGLLDRLRNAGRD